MYSPDGRFDFYPRPPRGGRHDYLRTNVGLQLFLSTPSARRATPVIPGSPPGLSISIHALREEGDVAADVVILYRNRFLSTPSARRATASQQYALALHIISIHALREEGDLPARSDGRLAS